MCIASEGKHKFPCMKLAREFNCYFSELEKLGLQASLEYGLCSRLHYVEVKEFTAMVFDLNMACALDLCNENDAENDAENESSDSPIDSSDASDDDDDNVVRVENLDESPRNKKNLNSSKSNSLEGKHGTPNENGIGGFEGNAELVLEMEAKLQVGACFGSLEQAHIFYCEYGRLKGFSIRRADQRYKGSSEEIRWKDFVCCCAGRPYAGVQNKVVRKFRKLVKRTNCTAKIRVHPIENGIWKNTLFFKDHNHPLLAPDQSHLLRSSRILSESRLGVLQSMNALGIPVNSACGFVEAEAGGPRNVGYIRKDAYNKLWRAKNEKRVLDGDSIALLEFLNSKTNSDPYFFWRARYDDECRLKDLFFRDSQSLYDYECFGDVLSVDTTYKTNRYILSCAPFVGINHHSTSIMFGVGFLLDELSETFEWLMGVFLESMNGKHPKVIFSDQQRALMNGIDRIFPNSTHRLCQWHVNNNAMKHFGSLNRNEEFMKLWYRCMNWAETEDDFENIWAEMMSKYVPATNTWLPEMYTLRHRWSSVFSRNIFTAGMVATSHSEGTNKVLKAMIKSSSTLHDLAQAYEKVQTRWRDVEREEDAACLWLPGQFVNKNDMLTQAATVYTRNMYKKFELQCTEAWNVVIDWRNASELGDGNVQFKATRSQYPNSRARRVTLNLATRIAHCSCCMWEGHGISFRHVLKVYQFMDVQLIPYDLILKRWTKNAKDYAFSEQASVIRSHKNNITKHMDFTNLIMRSQHEMVVAANDCDSAQEYLLRMMEKTKEGFQNVLRQGPSVAVDAPGPAYEKFQFRNPQKVKQKGPEAGQKKENKSAPKKRKAKNKCPGVSTRSRKRGKFADGPSFSGLDLNISLSQPAHNSNLGRFGVEHLDFHEEEFNFFATQ